MWEQPGRAGDSHLPGSRMTVTTTSSNSNARHPPATENPHTRPAPRILRATFAFRHALCKSSTSDWPYDYAL